MLLWANLHAGWFLGFIYLCLFIFIHISHKKDFSLSKQIVRSMSFLILLLILIVIFSPNHLNTIWYPLSYISPQNVSLQNVAEWQSPDLSSISYVPLALCLFLFLWYKFNQNRSFTLDSDAILLLFIIAGLYAQRNIAFLAVLLVSALIPQIQGTGKYIQSKATRLFVFISLICLTLSFILYVFMNGMYSNKLQLQLEPNIDSYPSGAVTFLAKHSYKGNLFSTYPVNNYLIYALWPRYKVFIDGRADIYPNSLYMAYTNLVAPSEAFNSIIKRYNITIFLLPNGIVENGYLQHLHWHTLYEDNHYTLYAKP